VFLFDIYGAFCCLYIQVYLTCATSKLQGSGVYSINRFLLHDVFVCRIETYNQSTKPIVEHYQKLDKVRNITADGSPEQVAVLLACLFFVYINY